MVLFHTMALPPNKDTLPPMMQRYVEHKERYPDAILFFQVGDFYELFFDDAVSVSKALNLTLTSRDKNSPNPIPMCGVPLSVLDSYVDRLLPLGFSVAVVSQSGSGAGVERALERFVTPGMRLFNSISSDSSESLIAAVGVDADGRTASLACTNPQTGIVSIRESIDLALLPRELATLMAHEVILPRAAFGNKIDPVGRIDKVDRRSSWVRGIESAVRASALRFRADPTGTTTLERGLATEAAAEFHALSVSGKRATRALFAYLDEISLGNPIPISELSLFRAAGHVVIDSATRRNLELVQNTKDGSSSGTLLGFINATATAGGARLLRNWLLAPLLDIDAILERQQALGEMTPHAASILHELEGLSDLERLAARTQLNIASPKDLAAIRETLDRMAGIQERLALATARLLKEASFAITPPTAALELLSRALVDNPPHVTHDGGVIRAGFDAELDQICAIRATADTWRTDFEGQERRASGISTLKVKSNNVIGFFLEVPTSQSAKVPAHYQRRQSMGNAERYTTPELKQHEDSVITAVDRQVRREQLLFAQLRSEISAFVGELRSIAAALSTLDCIASLALVAERNAWVEPQIVAESTLEIIKGRHPIIAALLEGAFIPNSVSFKPSGATCFVITGPNMGGKSTYLRQIALIAILAQIGSYVPAESARVGIVDRVFARLGAADDLHEGESTFMVEMREASHILAHASARSLVLIDELGRGTATTDGQSLAQAILEQLALSIKCRTLFATHYHEITALEAAHSSVANLSVGSIEQDDQIIFTHEIRSGPAPRSYGLEVAKLSGLPAEVIQRAYEVLASLPVSLSGSQSVSSSAQTVERRVLQQPDLFAPRLPESCPVATKLKERLKGINVDDISAREALALIYELKELQ